MPDSKNDPSDRSLGQLIDLLSEDLKVHGDRVIANGFENPHSYRGYYDELAFEPSTNVPLDKMLSEAQSALGRTFMGYKGGNYVMSEHTRVWLANYGSTGETLGTTLLRYMLMQSAARIPIVTPQSQAERDALELHRALTTAVLRIKHLSDWFGIGPNPAIAGDLKYRDLLDVLASTCSPAHPSANTQQLDWRY